MSTHWKSRSARSLENLDVTDTVLAAARHIAVLGVEHHNIVLRIEHLKIVLGVEHHKIVLGAEHHKIVLGVEHHKIIIGAEQLSSLGEACSEAEHPSAWSGSRDPRAHSPPSRNRKGCSTSATEYSTPQLSSNSRRGHQDWEDIPDYLDYEDLVEFETSDLETAPARLTHG